MILCCNVQSQWLPFAGSPQDNELKFTIFAKENTYHFQKGWANKTDIQHFLNTIYAFIVLIE